jgi:hypothetical protein
VSAIPKSMEDKIQQVWDAGHARKPRSQMIREVLDQLTEQEKEQALKDWAGGKLWNLHRAKKERVRANQQEGSS